MMSSGLILAAIVVFMTMILASRRIEPGQVTWWLCQAAVVAAFCAGKV